MSEHDNGNGRKGRALKTTAVGAGTAGAGFGLMFLLEAVLLEHPELLKQILTGTAPVVLILSVVAMWFSDDLSKSIVRIILAIRGKSNGDIPKSQLHWRERMEHWQERHAKENREDFKRLEDKIDKVNDRIDKLNDRFDKLCDTIVERLPAKPKRTSRSTKKSPAKKKRGL